MLINPPLYLINVDNIRPSVFYNWWLNTIKMIKDLLLYFALLLWFVVPLQAQPTIFAEDVEGKPGDEIEVLVKAENFVDVVAMQFTFEWDADVLEFRLPTI